MNLSIGVCNNLYLFCRKKDKLKNILYFISYFFFTISLFKAQQLSIDTIYVDSIPKKILYDKKIYKLNAGFTTIGAGYFLSNNFNYLMKGVSVNLNIHTFKEYFVQLGFTRINATQSFDYPQKKDVVVQYFTFHLSPLVVKMENLHFAFILNPIGLTYGGGYKDETYHYEGILAKDSTSTIQNNYFGMNLYSSFQCIYKFKYDLGIGTSVYAEYHQNKFIIIGLKLSFYLSAAFKGNQTKPAWYYKKNPDKN